jgi:alpha-methylacyl-CoA racemase
MTPEPPADDRPALKGPLVGVRVVEFSGIGPGPFAGMLLADMGAEVVCIDRPNGAPPVRIMGRGKASVTLDLKTEAGRMAALAAIEAADVLIEGFRPGVMERLGLGPEVACARNPRLIYGRMTGWGQSGPAARTAGHDLTYIAVTGALAAMGPPDRPPPPPLNLVGDFGGGSLYLVMGICAALFERAGSGQGQVIDAAIVDGVASMMGPLMSSGSPRRVLARDRSVIGGATPSYRCYACADGRYVAVGPLEPQFFAELIEVLELDPGEVGDRHDPAQWPRIIDMIERRFATRPRDEWAAIFADTDGCVAPVLDVEEAPHHPHLAGRGVFVNRHGLTQPEPAPRFGRTPGAVSSPAPALDEGGVERLRAWGVDVAS